MRDDYDSFFEGYMEGCFIAWFVIGFFVLLAYCILGVAKLIKYIYENRRSIIAAIKSIVRFCINVFKKLYRCLRQLFHKNVSELQ